MADRFPLDLLQTLLDDGRGPDVAPELRSAANVAEAMRRTGAHEVTCVIHADPHSGNSYLDADGRACWLDWQIVQRGQLVDRHQLPPRDRARRRDARAPTRPSSSATTSASSSRSVRRPRRGTTRGTSTRSASRTATSCGSSPASARGRSCSCTSRAWRPRSPTTTRSAASAWSDARVRPRPVPRGVRRRDAIDDLRDALRTHPLARTRDRRRLVAGDAARVRPGPRARTGATSTTSTPPRHG